MRRGSTCIVVAVDVNDSFVLRIRPWTWLKVSQQLRGRRTWFKAGTISRGIALRLTSAGPRVCVCTRETDSLVRSSRLPTLSFSFRSLLVPPIIFKNTLGISRVCIDVAAKCRSSHPAESPGFAIEFRTRDIFSSRRNKVVKKKKIGRWLIQFQIDNSLSIIQSEELIEFFTRVRWIFEFALLENKSLKRRKLRIYKRELIVAN